MCMGDVSPHVQTNETQTKWYGNQGFQGPVFIASQDCYGGKGRQPRLQNNSQQPKGMQGLISPYPAEQKQAYAIRWRQHLSIHHKDKQEIAMQGTIPCLATGPHCSWPYNGTGVFTRIPALVQSSIGHVGNYTDAQQPISRHHGR